MTLILGITDKVREKYKNEDKENNVDNFLKIAEKKSRFQYKMLRGLHIIWKILEKDILFTQSKNPVPSVEVQRTDDVVSFFIKSDGSRQINSTPINILSK